MKPLQDRVALVTGASREGGRGIAVVLGEQGATVSEGHSVSLDDLRLSMRVVPCEVARTPLEALFTSCVLHGTRGPGATPGAGVPPEPAGVLVVRGPYQRGTRARQGRR